MNAGGLKGLTPLQLTVGYGVATITGAGADVTNVFSFIVTSYSGVFGTLSFEPVETVIPVP